METTGIGTGSLGISGGSAGTLTLAPIPALAVAAHQTVVAVAVGRGAISLTAVAMSGSPGGGQSHHIATRYNGEIGWADMFRPMFEKAGLGLDDAENLVKIAEHAGPIRPSTTSGS